MTDRLPSGGCGTKGRGSDTGSVSSAGCASKPAAVGRGARYHKIRMQAVRRCNAQPPSKHPSPLSPLPPPPPPSSSSPSSSSTSSSSSLTTAMHVRKTWKNLVAMLFTVAVVTTATAAFYFNYTATACCVVAQSSSSVAAELPYSAASAAAAATAAAVESNRAKFGLSVLRASKLYAVCKTHEYQSRAVDRVSDVCVCPRLCIP